MPLFAGPGVTPSLRGNTTNVPALQACSVYNLSVAGWYELSLGPYTCLQEWDPITLTWRVPGGGNINGVLQRVYSDGSNYRIANLTGGAVGALITNAGSAYTSAPTVTASAGGSIWRAIVGGAVNTSVTVTNGGTGYIYAPVVLFSAPPPGGIQATGFCTLSGSAVSTVTVVDQGAGYLAAPQIVFVNDSREGQNGVAMGSGAAAVATLTGAGTITGLLCLDPGTAQTTIPTLAFSGGGGASAAATALMCMCVTAYTVGGGGTAYAGATFVTAFNGTTGGLLPPTTNFGTSVAYLNFLTQQNLVRGRPCLIQAALSAGAITATAQKLIDGGIYFLAAASLSPIIWSNYDGSHPSAAATLSLTIGGLTDESVTLTT